MIKVRKPTKEEVTELSKNINSSEFKKNIKDFTNIKEHLNNYKNPNK